MRFKANVTITFTLTNKIIMKAWEDACRSILGPDYEPECTSGLEGTHSLESGHYHGRAVDFATKDIPKDQHDMLVHEVQSILGRKYFVLNEGTHIHIQRNANAFP